MNRMCDAHANYGMCLGVLLNRPERSFLGYLWSKHMFGLIVDININTHTHTHTHTHTYICIYMIKGSLGSTNGTTYWHRHPVFLVKYHYNKKVPSSTITNAKYHYNKKVPPSTITNARYRYNQTSTSQHYNECQKQLQLNKYLPAL